MLKESKMVQAIMRDAGSTIEPATVVIDNGTGYSKMGYAGNMEPSYLIPSCIASHVSKVSKLRLKSKRLTY